MDQAGNKEVHCFTGYLVIDGDVSQYTKEMKAARAYLQQNREHTTETPSDTNSNGPQSDGSAPGYRAIRERKRCACMVEGASPNGRPIMKT